jgi:hypothetical protein
VAGCRAHHRPQVPADARTAARQTADAAAIAKLEPVRAYLDARLAQGITNCAVLLRELRVRGDTGGKTILREYVRPRRPNKGGGAPCNSSGAGGGLLETAGVGYGPSP